jgi:tetratricopeptide (TPR) repeat protein
LEPREYTAFISYSHRDTTWADWLHKSLEGYRVPRLLVGTKTARGTVQPRLTPIFRDREELPSATDLGAIISAALARSASQIVICSPEAARSRWVNEEILAFKRLGREDRIFCLIIDGEPNATDLPGREAEECFPHALRYRMGAGGQLTTERTEPIAADARPGKDGRQNARLKIIAGLLGLGLDALKRREQQRRNRRLAMIATGASVGMVITTGLAAYALVQRSLAEREKRRAEAEAETSRRTTDFLVDLFRISDPGEARGNTVTAREMLDKGAARIDAELAGQPGIQATLLDTVGTVYMGLGLYARARPLLDRAVATRGGLADAGPLALPSSLNHLGDLQTLQADFDAAARSYLAAADLAARHPEDRELQEALARSLQGLGTVQARQGHFDEAEKSLRAALDGQRKVHGEVHADIARGLQELANVIDQQGNLAGALDVMQRAETMQRRIHGSDPHPDLAAAINDLALLRGENGDYEAAERLFTEALAMKRRLLGEKHPEIALGLGNLASTLNDKGDLAAAESAYRQALAMQRELLGEYHPDVALTLNNLAFVQYDRGHAGEALQTELQSLAVYRHLFKGDHPEVARILNRVGYWLTLLQRYPEADRDLQDALAMRQRLLGPKHPDVASSLTHLAILQVARARYADALASARGALAICDQALPPNHWRSAVAEGAAGAALGGLGRAGEARQKLAHSLQVLDADQGAPQTYRQLVRGYMDRLQAREDSRARLATAG